MLKVMEPTLMTWTARWTPLLADKPALVRDTTSALASCLDDLHANPLKDPPTSLATELAAALYVLSGLPYGLNLVAIAAVALAEAHALGRLPGGEPDAAAATLVERLLGHSC